MKKSKSTNPSNTYILLGRSFLKLSFNPFLSPFGSNESISQLKHNPSFKVSKLFQEISGKVTIFMEVNPSRPRRKSHKSARCAVFRNQTR